MRLGFHDAHEFDDLWANLQEINIRQVAIHGRTRQQKYLGAAQWDPLYRASLSSSLPIIGSGDITSHSSPHLLYSKTKLAGALVGRGALRNPWIFYEIKNQKKLILTPDIFLNALSVFAGLQHALYTNSHGLFELMERGVFLTPHLNDNSKWQSTLEILMDVLKYPSGINLWPLEHKTLCRVKMIFNYLRFSLPTDHDTTHLLRISKWDHFWNALHQFLFNKLPREFSLNHNPNHDWVFSGAPNPNKVNLNDGINTKKGSSEPH